MESNGAGFGWQDMMIYKLGVEYSPYKSDWTYRLGGSLWEATQFLSLKMIFNIIAPGVSESHVTVGFSKIIDNKKGNAVHMSAMFSPESAVVGPNAMDPVQNY